MDARGQLELAKSRLVVIWLFAHQEYMMQTPWGLSPFMMSWCLTYWSLTWTHLETCQLPLRGSKYSNVNCVEHCTPKNWSCDVNSNSCLAHSIIQHLMHECMTFSKIVESLGTWPHCWDSGVQGRVARVVLWGLCSQLCEWAASTSEANGQ